jgi:nucleoside-diphosphate-sugar epimerase
MEFVRQFNLDARIVRIFNTYGPRSNPEDGRVVPNFCMQALRGEPITIYGDGSQTRSFCYVDDLVRGLLTFMDVDGLGGEVINLGNPKEQTVQTFAEQVISLLGSASPIQYVALPVNDPTRRCPDISKARDVLGWEPQVELTDGLRRTVEYFAQQLAVA